MQMVFTKSPNLSEYLTKHWTTISHFLELFLISNFSKTLVHPASGKKAIIGQAKKVSESVNDQENTLSILTKETEVNKNKTKPKMIEKVDKPKGNKRSRAEEDKETSGSKKAKTQPQSKTCRRKLLPQVKGQQQIKGFFRV